MPAPTPETPATTPVPTPITPETAGGTGSATPLTPQPVPEIDKPGA